MAYCPDLEDDLADVRSLEQRQECWIEIGNSRMGCVFFVVLDFALLDPLDQIRYGSRKFVLVIQHDKSGHCGPFHQQIHVIAGATGNNRAAVVVVIVIVIVLTATRDVVLGNRSAQNNFGRHGKVAQGGLQKRRSDIVKDEVDVSGFIRFVIVIVIAIVIAT